MKILRLLLLIFLFTPSRALVSQDVAREPNRFQETFQIEPLSPAEMERLQALLDAPIDDVSDALVRFRGEFSNAYNSTGAHIGEPGVREWREKALARLKEIDETIPKLVAKERKALFDEIATATRDADPDALRALSEKNAASFSSQNDKLFQKRAEYYAAIKRAAREEDCAEALRAVCERFFEERGNDNTLQQIAFDLVEYLSLYDEAVAIEFALKCVGDSSKPQNNVNGSELFKIARVIPSFLYPPEDKPINFYRERVAFVEALSRSRGLRPTGWISYDVVRRAKKDLLKRIAFSPDATPQEKQNYKNALYAAIDYAGWKELEELGWIVATDAPQGSHLKEQWYDARLSFSLDDEEQARNVAAEIEKDAIKDPSFARFAPRLCVKIRKNYPDLARDCLDHIQNALKDSNDANSLLSAKTIECERRFNELVGSELKLEGLDAFGKEFDWSAYRDKPTIAIICLDESEFGRESFARVKEELIGYGDAINVVAYVDDVQRRSQDAARVAALHGDAPNAEIAKELQFATRVVSRYETTRSNAVRGTDFIDPVSYYGLEHGRNEPCVLLVDRDGKVVSIFTGLRFPVGVTGFSWEFETTLNNLLDAETN